MVGSIVSRVKEIQLSSVISLFTRVKSRIFKAPQHVSSYVMFTIGALSLVVIPATLTSGNSRHSEIETPNGTASVQPLAGSQQENEIAGLESQSSTQETKSNTGNPTSEPQQEAVSNGSRTSISVQATTTSSGQGNGSSTTVTETVTEGQTKTITKTSENGQSTIKYTVDAGEDSESTVRVRERGDKIRIDFRERSETNN